MSKHTCEKEQVIDYIRQDVVEIKKDVKELLSFKSKVIGIQIAITTSITLIFNLLYNLVVAILKGPQ